MAISPGMIKILGSIASSAMSSKGKEESKPQPKLNANFLIDADKQAPLNQTSVTKREKNLVDRVSKRAKKRTDRIDRREVRRKERFEGRDINQQRDADGKLINKYQEKRGTDVGNFFRRFNDPSANQSPPSTTNTNNTQTNYEDDKEEETKTDTKLNTNWNIGGSTEKWLKNQTYKMPGYLGGDLDHTSVSLYNNKK